MDTTTTATTTTTIATMRETMTLAGAALSCAARIMAARPPQETCGTAANLRVAARVVAAIDEPSELARAVIMAAWLHDDLPLFCDPFCEQTNEAFESAWDALGPDADPEANLARARSAHGALASLEFMGEPAPSPRPRSRKARGAGTPRPAPLSIAIVRETMALAGAALSCAARVLAARPPHENCGTAAASLRAAARVVTVIDEPCELARVVIMTARSHDDLPPFCDPLFDWINEAFESALDALRPDVYQEYNLARARSIHGALASLECRGEPA